MSIVENYLAVWNEEKPVEEVFAEGATLTDPMARVSGLDAIAALIKGVREQFPGLVFSSGGPEDRHHDIARFTWHLGPDITGFDVVKLDADERVTEVLGFLDRVPPQ